MLTFPKDFQPGNEYVVELVEGQFGRRLYVRPVGSPQSQWYRFETVPVSGDVLLKWTRNPDEFELHPRLLTNGEGFVDTGGSWMREREWEELMRTSERVK